MRRLSRYEDLLPLAGLLVALVAVAVLARWAG